MEKWSLLSRFALTLHRQIDYKSSRRCYLSTPEPGDAVNYTDVRNAAIAIRLGQNTCHAFVDTDASVNFIQTDVVPPQDVRNIDVASTHQILLENNVLCIGTGQVTLNFTIQYQAYAIKCLLISDLRAPPKSIFRRT